MHYVIISYQWLVHLSLPSYSPSRGCSLSSTYVVSDCRKLILSLLRVINVKFPLRPNQKYYITQYGELDFLSFTQMKDDYAINSRYLTYTFSLWKVGRMYFLSSGVKDGLTVWSFFDTAPQLKCTRSTCYNTNPSSVLSYRECILPTFLKRCV